MTHPRLILSTFGTAICLLVAAASIQPANAEIIDRIVARVDDAVITKHDVTKAAKPYLVQQGMDPSVLDDPAQRDTIYKKVLKQLVNKQLIIQEASELNLSVDDAKVSTWIERTRKRQNLSRQQFKRMIERYGLDFSDYREQIRQNLLKMKVVRVKLGSQISISDREVEEVYQQEYGSLEGNKQKNITLEHILIRPDSSDPQSMAEAKQKAQKIREKIANGASFSELATKHSDGPSATEGGQLGSFQKGQLQKGVEEHAFDLQKGELSKVVQTNLGFHIMRVTNISMKAGGDVRQKKNQIRGQLRRKAIQEKMQQYLKKLREEAFIEITWE